MHISRSWSSALFAGSCMVMALAACDGPVHGLGPTQLQIAGSGKGGVSGSYALQTANGLAMPLLLSGTAGGDRVELMSGRIELTADSTYTLVLTSRRTSGTTQTPINDTDTGRYSIDGALINLLSTTDGQQFSATFDDRSIQLNVEYAPTRISYLMVFRR